MSTAKFKNATMNDVEVDDERLIMKRVVLPKDDDIGCAEEMGVIVSVDVCDCRSFPEDHITFVVQVDDEYSSCTSDDGLRELCADGIILLDKED